MSTDMNFAEVIREVMVTLDSDPAQVGQAQTQVIKQAIRDNLSKRIEERIKWVKDIGKDPQPKETSQ